MSTEPTTPPDPLTSDQKVEIDLRLAAATEALIAAMGTPGVAEDAPAFFFGPEARYALRSAVEAAPLGLRLIVPESLIRLMLMMGMAQALVLLDVGVKPPEKAPTAEVCPEE